jgi:hypothetical protein
MYEGEGKQGSRGYSGLKSEGKIKMKRRMTGKKAITYKEKET